MVLSISDISVIVFFIILGSIPIVALSNYICKKSFYQIYDELSKTNQTDEKKIQIINYLYRYIQEYSDEEILVFNFRFNRFKSNHWYSAIFIIITIFVFLVMVELGVSYINSGIFTVFIIPIIYLTPITLIWICFGKFGDKSGISNLKDILIFSIMKVVSILVIFFIYASLILVALNTYEQKHLLSFFDVLKPFINYGGLESISSIQFSLAGFFFTFAIGGTVIFSIINNYLKQKNKLYDTLSDDCEPYKKWFESNENNLTFKIQDIIKIDSKIKGYREALKDLRSKLDFDSVNELVLPVIRYKTFFKLVAIMYLLGILTLLLTKLVINLLFSLFILFSFLFMMMMYNIFKDYS